jgi:Bacterial Ig-like domain (group 3)
MSHVTRKILHLDARSFAQTLYLPLLLLAIACAVQAQPAGTVNLVRSSWEGASNYPGGGPIGTTTSVVSTINPVHPKHRVDYIATVTTDSGGTPTGTVTFRDGGSVIGTGQLFGNQAQLRYIHYTRDQTGPHDITASYSGDGTFAPSTSPVLTEFVKLVTKMYLQTSANPAQVGQPVTFSAAVNVGGSGVQDGLTIDFYDFKTLMGSAVVSGGNATFTTSSLSAKTHTIRAVYAGDDYLMSCNHALRQVITP